MAASSDTQPDIAGPQDSFVIGDQGACRADIWLKSIAGGILGMIGVCVLGSTKNMRPIQLDAVDEEWDLHGDEVDILLQVLVPAAVFYTICAKAQGYLSNRVGIDMIQESSHNISLKETVRTNSVNTAIVLALFLTMVIAMLQMELPFEDKYKRAVLWYRIFNLYAIECCVRGIIMCTLFLSYLEPLNNSAAKQFILDNLIYIGEPVTACISCLFFFVNVLVIWEFGMDGFWMGLGASIIFCYAVIRTCVVFSYLSKWKNMEIDDEKRAERLAVLKNEKLTKWTAKGEKKEGAESI